MKLLEKQKGITLVALVVTIIVLLILAAISFNLVFGENGIINRAKDAADASKKDTEDEILALEDLAASIDEFATGEVKITQVIDDNPGEYVTADGGTESNPYLIKSIEDLAAFSRNVNNGEKYEGKCFKLVQSLDFGSLLSYAGSDRDALKTQLTAGTGFSPIGFARVVNIDDSTIYFGGSFDGNNNYIMGLYENVQSGDDSAFNYNGLFGIVKGSIKKLGVQGKIQLAAGAKNTYAGGIAGFISGNIVDCYNKVILDTVSTGNVIFGGVSGIIVSGNASNCANLVDLDINACGKMYVGGVFGNSNDATMQNCSNLNKINILRGVSFARVGGVVAYPNSGSSIIKCLNKGELTVKNVNSTHLGGICAYGNASNIKIEECYNIGKIDAEVVGNVVSYIGGIVGIYEGSINTCYNNADINVNNAYTIRVGGLVGYFEGVLNNTVYLMNSYNLGNINCDSINTSVYVGGCTGFISNYGNIEVDNVFNNGNIVATNSNEVAAGGIAGGSEYRGDVASTKNIVKNVCNSGNINLSDNSVIKLAGIMGVARGTDIDTAFSMGDLVSQSNASNAIAGIVANITSVQVTNSKYKAGSATYAVPSVDSVGMMSANLDKDSVASFLNNKSKEYNASVSDQSKKWLYWRSNNSVNNGYPSLTSDSSYGNVGFRYKSFDSVNLNDINNYRSGDYIYTNGIYSFCANRIAFKEYVETKPGDSYTFNFASGDYNLLVREMDENFHFLRNTRLGANGTNSIYDLTVGNNTKYLAIAVFMPSNDTNARFNSFEEGITNGRFNVTYQKNN